MKRAVERSTKYVVAVRKYMEQMGHATNNELVAVLRTDFPDVSVTTVHRITTRLVARGELQIAPNDTDNAMRFDANMAAHDHFICISCGMIRDATIAAIVRPIIEQAVGDGCSISGSLTVSGICKQCTERQRRNLALLTPEC